MNLEQSTRDEAFVTHTLGTPKGDIVVMACRDQEGRVYGAVIDGPSLTITPFLKGEDAGREFVRRVKEAAYRE